MADSTPIRPHARDRRPRRVAAESAVWLVAFGMALASGPRVAGSAPVWDPRGVIVCDSCFADLQKALPDGQGGAFVAWRDVRNYPSTGDDIFAQRLTSEGSVASGWPSSGRALCRAPGDQALESMAPDGEGGFLVSWSDQRTQGEIDVYVQRIRSDGTVAPGWMVDGVAATRAPQTQDNPTVAPDGTGGAYVAWNDWRDYPASNVDLYVQHITAAGSVWPGWPADGMRVGVHMGDQGFPRMLPDGSGGVLITWGHATSDLPDVYAIRILPDGSVAPGWPAEGRLVFVGHGLARIEPDLAGGFYLAAGRVNDEGWDDSFRVQRLTLGGDVVPGWPLDGLVVCRPLPGNRAGIQVAADGEGGLLLTWYDYRLPGGEILASRVTPQSTLSPGWPLDGLFVSDPPAPGFHYGSVISSDRSGGAYVAWQIDRTFEGQPEVVSFLQHLSGEGTVAPGWPVGGVRVAPSQFMNDPILVPDGAGGVIVFWDELRLHAQRFAADGVVAARLALASADVTRERVRLEWRGVGAGALEATLERRVGEGEWRQMGRARPEGPDVLTFEDRDVVPGERHSYRLAYREDGVLTRTPEHRLEVPMAAALALAGFAPNPSPGAARIAFTLPDASPATLEVHDIAGRLVLRRDVGALGAGRHVVAFGHEARLGPGVYLIRLRGADSLQVARGVVAE